ncbi:MAG: Rpp14/Pop5 family protein [Candidatus Woesearchaeota archaeon]
MLKGLFEKLKETKNLLKRGEFVICGERTEDAYFLTMAKLKRLSPTLREKKRYLVFKIVSKEPLADISRDLMKGLQQQLGAFGLARAGISILPDMYQKQVGILRISNAMLDEGRAALACISSLNRIPVVIHTIGVSGILKKAKSKFMEV